MLRVRDVLDGADRSAPLRLRLSPLHPIAEATDEWFYLRARSEQVIAEANAMAVGRAAPVDLEDEYGTGAARLRPAPGRPLGPHLHGPGRAGGVGGAAAAVGGGRAAPVEPEDQDVLEDLVVELLADPVGEVQR